MGGFETDDTSSQIHLKEGPLEDFHRPKHNTLYIVLENEIHDITKYHVIFICVM